MSLDEVEVTLRLTVSQSVSLGIEYPCGTCDEILQVEVKVTLLLTVSQSVSMSWYRPSLWELQTDIFSCRNIVV
jgi:hypothetical protein